MSAEAPDYTQPPELFPWGYRGIPAVLREYLLKREVQLRTEREQSTDDIFAAPVLGLGEVGDGAGYFPKEAVDDVARELHAKVLQNRAAPGSPKGQVSKLPADIADWVFALHAFCALRGRPAPPALLWLTFDALGLTTHQPTMELLRQFCGVEVRRAQDFIVAACIDGEYSGRGERMTEEALSRATGIPRTTLREWRRMESYQRIGQQRLGIHHPEIIDSWSRAIARLE